MTGNRPPDSDASLWVVAADHDGRGHLNRRTAVFLYYGLNLALGAFVGLNWLEPTIQLAVVVGGIIGLLFYRIRVLKAGSWSAIEMAGGAFFFLGWIPLAILFAQWPFG